ncbi:MAG: orotidine-5'-phosphate decarboxylase, partial [bacterium]|nr:orotidine-5'-phosphate decarboxylase [bacterium]
MEAKDRIIVALDVLDVEKAKELVQMLSPYVGLFKVGLGFIWSSIANLLIFPESEAIDLLIKIRALAKEIGGEKCFLDGKFADIPNTVKDASVAVSRLGVKMFNVHASAGIEAIKAAVNNSMHIEKDLPGLDHGGPANFKRSLVLGVTVLTSIDEDECKSIFGDTPDQKVFYFALRLAQNKADGIICSPQELRFLSQYPQAAGDLIKVTPGVRPVWAAQGDQKRVMTPSEAIKVRGADYLVIGRPITNPPEEIGGPVEAA